MTPEEALEQFSTDLQTAMTAAHDAGNSVATIARAASLVFSGLFAEQLAQDPDDMGLFNALKAERNAADALTRSIEDGD